jgi:hypothetical protein
MREVTVGQQDIAHVVLAPPKALDPELVKRVASLVGKEIFDTRLLLIGEIPRIIAHFPDADTADLIAQGMREAGLEAFVCKDSELRSRSAGFAAHTIQFGDKEVIFRDKRGGEAKVEAGDVFLIIRGRMRSYKQEETSTTKMKLNVAATVLTGGIPVMKRVIQKTTKGLLQTDDFVRVYDRRSSNPRIEMFQNRVDYGFLGTELSPSTAENFKIVVKKLREWSPQAIFDERLIKSFKTDVPAAGPEEAIELNCKLIYLSHLASDRRGLP